MDDHRFFGLLPIPAGLSRRQDNIGLGAPAQGIASRVHRVSSPPRVHPPLGMMQNIDDMRQIRVGVGHPERGNAKGGDNSRVHVHNIGLGGWVWADVALAKSLEALHRSRRRRRRMLLNDLSLARHILE